GSDRLDPVVPSYEVEHVQSLSRPPSEIPTLVYLGNGDRYQGLDRLFAERFPHGVRLRWVANHIPDPELAARARSAGFEIRVANTAHEALALTADAWWGLCPREDASGYPYKLLTYAMLGLPVLGYRPWSGPVEVSVVGRFGEMEYRGAPARLDCTALHRARERSLERMETLYRSL
ncbi:MAG: hypothetical protein AAFQ82_20000, partial [Myxococcota bacterium]